MKISKFLRALAIAGLCSGSLRASTLSFDLVESGSNIINLTVSGSISSLADWTFVTSYTSGQSPGIQPSTASVHSYGGTQGDMYQKGSTAPSSIGSSSSIPSGTWLSGGVVGFQAAHNGNSYLFLPKGYVPGTAINASSRWLGQTFSSMGLTPGAYSWTAGPDTIEINVGAVTSPVPEPGAVVPLGALCAAGLLLRQRRGKA